LFRTERGIRFDLLDDLFGPFDIAAMLAVRLGQFQPETKIGRFFPGFSFQNFDSRADISVRQQFIKGGR
jgi:hypothetical protein